MYDLNNYFCWGYIYIYIYIYIFRSGRCTQRNAAKEFGIPKTTLGDMLRGKIADDARSDSSTFYPV